MEEYPKHVPVRRIITLPRTDMDAKSPGHPTNRHSVRLAPDAHPMTRNRTPDDPTRDVAKHGAKPARKQGAKHGAKHGAKQEAKPIRRLC